MPRRPAAKSRRRNNSIRANRPKRRSRLSGLWPSASNRGSWRLTLRQAPAGAWLITTLVTLAALFLAVNWIYQVARKPSELFFPVSGTLYKTPPETWREYGPAFRKYATSVIPAELLAALAQVEGSGNPIVRTYWRWSWSLYPFRVYRPASSAVGMYQITDGTFALARRFCIRDHVVLEAGAWDDWRSCWFNGLYTRVIPSHAIELTAAYLDRSVIGILEHHRLAEVTSQQKQELATLIHLCGAGAGDLYARRHFHLTEGQRCGDHEARMYIERVNSMRRVFSQLAVEADE